MYTIVYAATEGDLQKKKINLPEKYDILVIPDEPIYTFVKLFFPGATTVRLLLAHLSVAAGLLRFLTPSFPIKHGLSDILLSTHTHSSSSLFNYLKLINEIRKDC